MNFKHIIMPASLNVLPGELLTQIVANIQKCGWLLDLALCCRSFYDLVVPYLYSHVKLIAHPITAGCPALEKFAIQVLRNLTLASYVQDFTLDYKWSSCSESIQDYDSIRFDSIRETLCRTNRFEEADVVENKVALLAVLLPSLKNIERLDLWVPDEGRVCYREMFRKVIGKEKPFDVQPAFPLLKVMVNNFLSAKRYCMSPSLMCHNFQLPSLREFYRQGIGSSSSSADFGLYFLKPAISSLTHLEIRRSRLCRDDLYNMLRAFKGLRTFVYRVGLEDLDYISFSIPRLREALEWVKHSLENLWIDNTETFIMDVDYLPPSTSLASLKVLKNIRVGMYIFFGDVSFMHESDIANGAGINLARLLPQSLETIYISHTRARLGVLVEALEDWLQQKESSTPKLWRIAFEVDLTEDRESIDLSLLESLAKEASVSVVKLDSGISDQDASEADRRILKELIPWAAEGSQSCFEGYVNAGKT